MMTALLTAITMIAFAANSLLCRGALAPDAIDPYSFTAIRIGSGALVLFALVAVRTRVEGGQDEGSWGSAAALLGYALAFSLAYVTLDAGTGALILFGAVQVTMLVGGLIRGERPPALAWIGLLLAAGGLIYLVFPGITAPDLAGAAFMSISGISWGLYSLRGRGSSYPLIATSRNFRFAVPLALVAALFGWGAYHFEPAGVALAVTSGALASGLGYALWYRSLKGLTDTTAAIVQLSVPVIAAVGGIMFLGEEATLRLAVSSALILGGIALTALVNRRVTP
jgi:drug/metabolite transporter (DMT)-like permease